jgi:hypothetical protein
MHVDVYYTCECMFCTCECMFSLYFVIIVDINVQNKY